MGKRSTKFLGHDDDPMPPVPAFYDKAERINAVVRPKDVGRLCVQLDEMRSTYMVAEVEGDRVTEWYWFESWLPSRESHGWRGVGKGYAW